jgi:hypothetical protein
MVQTTFPHELYCQTGSACGGVCGMVLDNDPYNCGSCDNLCGGGVCAQGECAVLSDCAEEGDTCDDICAEQGLGDCLVAEGEYGTQIAGLVGDQCGYYWGAVNSCSAPLEFGEFVDIGYGEMLFGNVYCICAE